MDIQLILEFKTVLKNNAVFPKNPQRTFFWDTLYIIRLSSCNKLIIVPLLSARNKVEGTS